MSTDTKNRISENSLFGVFFFKLLGGFLFFLKKKLTAGQTFKTMVKIGLQIRAQLENVDEIRTNHPEYTFFLKFKCSNCGEQSEKWHDLTESERVQEDSRNPNGFSFFMKCKLCSRENSIDIVEGSNSA